MTMGQAGTGGGEGGGGSGGGECASSAQSLAWTGAELRGKSMAGDGGGSRGGGGGLLTPNRTSATTAPSLPAGRSRHATTGTVARGGRVGGGGGWRGAPLLAIGSSRVALGGMRRADSGGGAGSAGGGGSGSGEASAASSASVGGSGCASVAGGGAVGMRTCRTGPRST